MVAPAVSPNETASRSLVGRPPGSYDKYTPETVSKFLGYLSQGYTLSLSCDLVDISITIYRRWLERGEQGDPDFVSFVSDVTRAKALGRQKHHDRIDAASEHDWKASAWLLPRLDPEGYADQSKRQIDVNVSGQVQTTNIHVLTPVALPDLYRLLAGAGALQPGVIEGPSTPGDEQT